LLKGAVVETRVAPQRGGTHQHVLSEREHSLDVDPFKV
jgi:hypothetical protein